MYNIIKGIKLYISDEIAFEVLSQYALYKKKYIFLPSNISDSESIKELN